MKRILLLGFCVIAVVFFLNSTIACNVVHGSGKLISEKRDLSGFTGIEAGGAIDIEVTQADSYSVEIEADKNLMPHVRTTVESGTLKISTEDMNFDFFDHSTVHVKISMPKLSSFELAGASKGIAKNIKTDKLSLDVSGASKLIVAGTASSVNSEISGASKLEAKDLIADNVEVDCAGASKAYVHANATLKISAAGASNVIYSGSAKVSEESSGASSVERE